MLAFFKDRFFYGWMVTGAGLLIAVIGLGARYSFGVFLKSIEGEFDLTRGATSSIFSVYMLLCVLLAVIGGWALDRYGPRKVALLMGSFTGLSLLLTSQADSAWQLFITYGLLLSIGTGPTYTVVNSTTSRWFDKKRGIAVGITSSGGGLGAIIIAPLATYLISTFGWRTACVLLGLIAWVVMGSMSLLLRRDPGDVGLSTDGMQSEPPEKAIESKGNNAQSADYTMLQASRMKAFWFLGFTWLFLSLTLHLLFVHVAPYAMGMGISPMDAAVVLGVMGAASIPGRLVIGKASDAIGKKALAVACALIQVVSLLWLMWAQELWMLYAFATAFGFFWGGFSTLITVFIGDVFGLRSLGAIMGMLSAGWAFGAAVGPAMGGYIFDVTGNYLTAFAAGAAAILLAAAFVALIGRSSEQRAAPESV